jgi:hypothetical protein
VAFSPGATWPARTAARRRAALAIEFGLQLPLSRWLTGTLGVGHRELDAPGTSGYRYGSASLTLQTHRVSFELGHYGTDGHGRWLFGERVAGRRTVFTAMVTF